MAEMEEASVQYGPAGIGGWLLLPLLHLLIFIGGMAVAVAELFTNGNGAANMVAGAGAFAAALFRGSVSTEQWITAAVFVTTSSILLYPVLCLVQFFRKKSGVPRLMIGFYVLILAVQAINLAMAYFLPDASTELGPVDENLWDLCRGAVAALIWIPYFITSERVGNTFVR